jgi:hypothetical protein
MDMIVDLTAAIWHDHRDRSHALLIGPLLGISVIGVIELNNELMTLIFRSGLPKRWENLSLGTRKEVTRFQRHEAIRTWHRFGRIKLLPVLIASFISVLIPLSLIFRVAIGTVLYIVLYCITWRRADGSRAFPPYVW